MVASPNYAQLYAWCARQLPSSFEASQLFSHCTGHKHHELPVIGSRPVPEEVSSQMERLCARRQEGYPLQYLLGEWEFYGLPFAVGDGVLIPRADTEVLVDLALELLPALSNGRQPPPEVLDLCSGSGCIAAAIAHCHPGCRVTAVELSQQAFGYLESNLRRNRVAVRAVLGDVLEYTHPLPVDLLVSNPPYIPAGELPFLQREVSYEPRAALDGGTDGMDFYRSIVRRFSPQLRKGGWLCVEVGAGQSGPVSGLLEAAGFSSLEIRRDLGGISRVVAGQK